MNISPIHRLIWAAGILDGEGCIRIHRSKTTSKNTPWFGLVVSIAMTCEKTLNELQNVFKAGKVKPKNCGPRPKHYKPMYHWIVTGFEAESMLAFTYPFLITKQKQAKVGLMFRRIKSGKNGRKTINHVTLHQKERLYKIIKHLKTL